MADETAEIEADEEVLEAEIEEQEAPANTDEVEETETVDPESDDAENSGDDDSEEEEEEIVVEIEGESPPQEKGEDDGFRGKKAPQFVKDLRKSDRENKKRIKELERKLKEKKDAETAPVEIKLGPEPDLYDDGIDGDPETFKSRWRDWNARKSEADKREQEAKAKQQRDADEWKKRRDSYEERKKAFKVDDFEDFEDRVSEKLSATQQGIIVGYMKEPEALVYAIGRNPKNLERLAAITDPVEFTLAVSELQSKMKVTRRKAATKPETVIEGTVPVVNSGKDSKLERLRDKADRTGNMTEVLAYKKQLREAEKQKRLK